MSRQKLKLSLTLMISPDYHGGTKLEITDELSRVQFADIHITEEQLVCLLGRQAGIKCDAEVRHLDKVGKKKESKPFTFEVSEYRPKEEAERKAQELCPEGWMPSLYFGSQSSFHKGKDGKYYANTHIYRFVDVGEKQDENTES